MRGLRVLKFYTDTAESSSLEEPRFHEITITQPAHELASSLRQVDPWGVERGGACISTLILVLLGPYLHVCPLAAPLHP